MKDKNGIEVIVTPAMQRPKAVPNFYNDDEKIVNLNTHIVRVKNDRQDITYKCNGVRPRIVYKHIPDVKAPGAFILRTESIEGLPMRIDGILFIVNRDTVSATRKIENHMREMGQFDKAFAIVDANPGNWIKKINETFSKGVASDVCRYVQRFDLRAPGEQVRGKDNKVSYCKELISDFD